MIFRVALLSFAMGFALQAQSAIEAAQSAFEQGNLSEAARSAQNVKENEPDSSRAHLILGLIAARHASWAAAEREFKASIMKDPNSPWAYFYLGQAHLSQHHWRPAAKYLGDALRRNYPDRNRLAIELAMAQTEAGQPEGAISTLAGISPAAGSQAVKYYLMRSHARLKLSEPIEALSDLRLALGHEPGNADVRELLVSTLLSCGRIKEAIPEAIEAQRRFPDHATIQFLLGLSGYFGKQEYLIHVALRNLREADSNDARVLLLTGMLDRLTNHLDQAAEAFTQAASNGLPDAHLLLGLVKRETGDMGGAEREFRAAERINPQNGQVQFELGKLLLGRGSLQDALVRLLRAERVMPDAPAVHYQLGVLFARCGDTRRSEQHLAAFRRLSRTGRSQMTNQPPESQ